MRKNTFLSVALLAASVSVVNAQEARRSCSGRMVVILEFGV